jgi:multidrug resistance efflux pump
MTQLDIDLTQYTSRGARIILNRIESDRIRAEVEQAQADADLARQYANQAQEKADNLRSASIRKLHNLAPYYPSYQPVPWWAFWR